MKKRMLLAIIMAIALLCGEGLAAARLSGSLEGGAIEVEWSVAGELTVLKDNWPLYVRNVTGPGRARFDMDDPDGRYTLRLKTSGGVTTANVSRKSAGAQTQAEVRTAVISRDDLAGHVVDLVNAERAKQGLRALKMNAELTRAARVRAGEITRTFSHTRPNGASWSTVSASAYGENIARGQKSAEKVVAAWMSSSTGHRENILRPGYGSIGVCAVNYNGMMYWVQLFGR